jgi:hypothetical protein
MNWDEAKEAAAIKQGFQSYADYHTYAVSTKQTLSKHNLLLDIAAEIFKNALTPQWINVKDNMPEHNEAVLVFIPGEDDHITSGMWDVSNKWVLLDEYRVPDQEVTRWMKLPETPKV